MTTQDLRNADKSTGDVIFQYRELSLCMQLADKQKPRPDVEQPFVQIFGNRITLGLSHSMLAVPNPLTNN